MAFRTRVCVLLAFLAVSCQGGSEPKAPPPEQEQKGEDAVKHVRVEGGGWPPEAKDDAGKPIQVEAEGWPEEMKQAFGVYVKEALKDAFREAITQGLKEMLQKLKVSDEVEAKLLFARYDLGTSTVAEDGQTLSYYLIRPRQIILPPETIELTKEGKVFLRFTRAYAKVERPLAIVTLSRKKAGRPVQWEAFLTYDPKDGWKASRVGVKKEQFGDR